MSDKPKELEEEIDTDEKIKRLIDETIDELSNTTSKLSYKISNLLASISEDKLKEMLNKGRIILKQKLRKDK